MKAVGIFLMKKCSLSREEYRTELIGRKACGTFSVAIFLYTDAVLTYFRLSDVRGPHCLRDSSPHSIVSFGAGKWLKQDGFLIQRCWSSANKN